MTIYPNGTQVRLLRPEEIASMPTERCFSNTTGMYPHSVDGGYYGQMPTLTGVIKTYDADTGRYLVEFGLGWTLNLLPQEFTTIVPLMEGGAE